LAENSLGFYQAYVLHRAARTLLFALRIQASYIYEVLGAARRCWVKRVRDEHTASLGMIIPETLRGAAINGARDGKHDCCWFIFASFNMTGS
jgi:hypothetical protein